MRLIALGNWWVRCRGGDRGLAGAWTRGRGRRDVSICYKLPAATITLIIGDKTNCCNDNEDNFVWLLTIDCLTKNLINT